METKGPKFEEGFSDMDLLLYGVLYPLAMIVMCGIAEFINQL